MYLRSADFPAPSRLIIVDGKRTSPTFNTIVAQLALGREDGSGDIAVDQSGNRVVVTSNSDFQTAVINALTDTVVNTVPAVMTRFRIGINPVSHRAFVTGGVGFIQAIDLATGALQSTIVATFILLIFLVWLILFITHGRFLKHTFENIATRSLEREVKVDGDFELYFAPVQVKFMAQKMRIANPQWASKPSLFIADRIDTRISTWRLIFGDVHFRRLLLDGAAADLEWSKDGKSNTWTFAKDEPAKPFELPHIRQASIKGTTLRYRDPRLQLSADIGIDTVQARDTRFTDDIRFHGDGRMRVNPFTLSGSLMSPNETLAGGSNKLSLNAWSPAARGSRCREPCRERHRSRAPISIWKCAGRTLAFCSTSLASRFPTRAATASARALPMRTRPGSSRG